MRAPHRPHHLVAVARERHEHLGLDARLDHHDLGALAEAAHQAERLALGVGEARRGETSVAFMEAEVSSTTTTRLAP